MQFINDNTVGLRQQMVNAGIPAFGVNVSIGSDGYVTTPGIEAYKTAQGMKAQSDNYDKNYQAKWSAMAANGGGTSFENQLGYEDYISSLKLMWDCKVIGAGIPDNISLGLTISSTFVRGNSMEYTLNFLTRGDIGFYRTTTQMDRAGAEFNMGINLNLSYFTGNPLMINESTLFGSVRNVSGGYFWGGEGFVGYDKYGNPIWVGIGAGAGITAGSSYGWGNTTSGWFK